MIKPGSIRWLVALSLAALLGACKARVDLEEHREQPRAVDARPAFELPDPETAVHGRIEQHEGLRVLRLWGTPEQRGRAHGKLLAADILEVMNREFAARFEDSPELLLQARAALPRLIEYPEGIVEELDALWLGFLEAGVGRRLPGLGRDMDKQDLLIANALDVFGLMGCSSFSVWGDQAVGGGVLTARNFDWPLTGKHMLEQTVLIVQHPHDAQASASIAWPGYVGTVTGISGDGVAAYLHVGSAKMALPQPSSWPSAIATRKLLEAKEQAAARIAKAEELLDYTSPPVGFMTHVVLPEVPEGARPVAVFETSAKDTQRGKEAAGPFVVTNHFRTRTDGRSASGDSTGREQTLTEGIGGCMELADQKVDVDEAWQLLTSVEAGGNFYFGTLHSLVFRHEPWHFEVRVAAPGEDGLIGAPSSPRRYRLTREQVFGGR